MNETMYFSLSEADHESAPIVLVVDDQPMVLQTLVDMLPCDYRIHVALNGEKALGIAQGMPQPDVILLDISMPGMDGYEVCRRLKAEDRTRSIPVVFVTGLDDEQDEEKGLSLGAEDYISKPFRSRTVRARVQNLIARKRAERAEQNVAVLRQLARSLQAAREEECRRIAVRLHDDVGQLLTRARLDAMLLEDAIEAATEPATGTLLSLKESIDEAVATIRTLSVELRPAILDDFGLTAALEWSFREDEKRLRIPISFTTQNLPEPLDSALSLACYRVARECLTNIGRHAQASHVTIQLSGRGGALVLRVEDDGCGFRPGSLSDADSFGLTQMRERALAMDGALSVKSSPGRGTTVVFSSPIDKP